MQDKSFSFYYIYIYILFPTLAAVPVEKLSENYVFLNYRKKLKNTIENIRRICYTIHVVEIKEATNKECTLIIKYRILKATCPRGQAGNRRRGCRRREEALQ